MCALCTVHVFVFFCFGEAIVRKTYLIFIRRWRGYHLDKSHNQQHYQHAITTCPYQGAVAELKRELEEGLGLWRAQLLAAQVRTSLTTLVVRIVMMVMMGMILILWYIIALYFCVGNIDEQCRGPSIKEKDHLAG